MLCTKRGFPFTASMQHELAHMKTTTAIHAVTITAFLALCSDLLAQPFTNWRFQNGGASNVYTFETTKIVPQRLEIRIRVVRAGEGHIRIENAEKTLILFPE